MFGLKKKEKEKEKEKKCHDMLCKFVYFFFFFKQTKKEEVIFLFFPTKMIRNAGLFIFFLIGDTKKTVKQQRFDFLLT